MEIQHINNKHAAKVHVQKSFSQGQIIQGKIIKIYPNNMAQIQLGSQKMIAQLETPLTVGERYHFQVQDTGEIVHLKVIGDKLAGKSKENILGLMRQLGLKPVKQNIDLIKQLIQEKIPFSKEQITKALSLLDTAVNKTAAQEILKDMISTGLPVKDTIFDAIYTKNTTKLSEHLSQLLLELKQAHRLTNTQQLMLNKLELLMEKPGDPDDVPIRQIISEAKEGGRQLFLVLKSLGTIESSVEYTKWQEKWLANGKLTDGKASLPYRLTPKNIMQQLLQIKDIKPIIEPFIQEWKTSSLNRNDYTVIKNQLDQTVLPKLPQRQAQVLASFIKPDQLSLDQLETALRTLSSEETNTLVKQLLLKYESAVTFKSGSKQEQFLQQLKMMLQQAGLNHENQLKHHLPEQSIKSVLLSMLHDGGGVNDRPSQLLHFINGLQLHSVQDTANLVQASLQFPAEKLGLNKDVQIDFEGKKTENGTISSDYCRIIFYLDLTNLHETVIDMNVQKRSVSVTIYNDSNDLDQRSTEYKPLLKSGLANLDYQLSSITFKPIEKKQSFAKHNETNYLSANRGVDYRI